MMVNGKMIKEMEKEQNIFIMAINMKEIGEMVNLKEKEFIIMAIMVIDMKVNGEMIIKKEKEFIILQMVIEEWVII